MFTWWDRAHRTLGLNISQDEVQVGVPAYTLPGDNRVRNALLMPFQKQRAYWRRPDGTRVTREPSASEKDSARLAG